MQIHIQLSLDAIPDQSYGSDFSLFADPKKMDLPFLTSIQIETVQLFDSAKLTNSVTLFLFIVIVYQCCGAEPAKAGAAIPTFGSGSLVAL